MEWNIVLIVLIVLLFVLLAMGVWISFAMGVTGVIGLLLVNPHLLGTIGFIAWSSGTNFVLVAVPLFIWMGFIIEHSGLAGRFYAALSIWLDRVPGGLLHSNIIACTIFAAVSASSIATAATIGSVAIPEMEKRGYDLKLTYGSLAAGGTLGILIPPSIAMIVYGAMTDTSVGQLFIAGIFPGLALSGLFMIYIAIRTVADPHLVPRVAQQGTRWKTRVASLKELGPIMMLIVVVLGGIYFGFCTPTEAGAVGAAGAILISLSYGKLSLRVLRESLFETIMTTSMIFFIIAGAGLLSSAFSNAEIPSHVVKAIAEIKAPPMVIFSLIVLLYLVLGCFIESLSMVLLTLPLIFPVVKALGFDPIWFGIIMVVLIELALITPPVAMNVFVIQQLAKDRSLNEVSLGTLPFAGAMLLLIGILVAFPSLVLWLPHQMYQAY